MIIEILTDIGEEIEQWCLYKATKAVKWEEKQEIIRKYIEKNTNDYNTYNCVGNRLILQSIELKRSVKVMYLPMKENNIVIDVAGKLPLYIKAIEKTVDYFDNKGK